MQFKMDHIVLNVVDIDKMLDFYMNVLQMTGERLAEFSENRVPFPSVRLTTDTIVDLFPREMWEKNNPDQVCRPNLNHFCMVTSEANWKRLRENLEKHDVPIDEGPVERWGAHGTGISIYFRDPEENVIEVRYYEAAEAERPCLLGS
jgi:extradiol dioxygenase family protein